LLIDPLPSVPPRRGHLQEVPEFVLPLDHKRLGDKDEDRFVTVEGHQLGGEGQLNGFSQTYLISQEIPGAAVLMGVEGQLDEGFLVCPEAVLLAIDGQFHNRLGGSGLFLFPGVDVRDDNAVDQPGHVLHDRLSQVRRLRGGPQGIEFLLYPPDALLAFVQPDQFIVVDPSRPGLVGAADKTDLRAIRSGDHAGLAVDQPEGLIGEDLYLEKAAPDKIIEPLEPCLHRRPDLGGKRGAPFAVHSPLGRSGGLDIQGIEAGVADDPGAGLAAFRCHPFKSLSRNLQQRGAKKAGNPIIAVGALQLGGQEVLQGAAA